jgi:Tfp pilus assembly protein PilO
MMLQSSNNKMTGIKSFRRTVWLLVLSFLLAVGLILLPAFKFAGKQYQTWMSGQRKIGQARQLIAGMPGLMQENKDLLQQNYLRLASYDQDVSQSKLLNLLLEAARQSQVSFVSIRPFPLKDQGKYYQLDFKLEIRAGYHQLGSFFGSLEKGNSLVRFSDLKMTGDKSGAPVILSALNGQAMFIKTNIDEKRLDTLLAQNKQVKGKKDTSFIYTAKYRDPFLPSGSTEAMVAQKTGPIYRLKGVVWDAKNPLAVVMDEGGVTYFLRAGEKMGTDRLMVVKQNMVTFKRANGTRYDLKTFE